VRLFNQHNATEVKQEVGIMFDENLRLQSELRAKEKRRSVYGTIILTTTICVVVFWIVMALRPASAMDIMPGDHGRWHGYMPSGYIGAHPSNRGAHSCTWSITERCANWRAVQRRGVR
jgi:hypothetical protein